MINFKVLVNTISKAKNFVECASKCDVDVAISDDKYCVNAKSILGVFSMNLINVLDLEIHDSDETKRPEYVELFKEFIIE